MSVDKALRVTVAALYEYRRRFYPDEDLVPLALSNIFVVLYSLDLITEESDRKIVADELSCYLKRDRQELFIAATIAFQGMQLGETMQADARNSQIDKLIRNAIAGVTPDKPPKKRKTPKTDA